MYSFFVLDGTLELNGTKMNVGDFAIVKQEEEIKIKSIERDSRIFIIKTPLNPCFETYAMMMR